MNPTRTLRDRLLLVLGVASLGGCIDEVTVHDDGGPMPDAAELDASQDAEADARSPLDMTLVVDGHFPDARVPPDAGHDVCEPGFELWCVPMFDDACLTTEEGSSDFRIADFLSSEIDALCGVSLRSGPHPAPEGEAQPCCYCLMPELCGGRPFVVAQRATRAAAVARADWV